MEATGSEQTYDIATGNANIPKMLIVDSAID